jgi:hypothetical protein
MNISKNVLSDEIINNIKRRIHGTVKSLLGWYRDKNDKKECVIIDITHFILNIFIKDYNDKKIIKYISNNCMNHKYFIYINLINNSYILQFVKNNICKADKECTDIFFININKNKIYFQKINIKTKLMLYASIDIYNIYFNKNKKNDYYIF